MAVPVANLLINGVNPVTVGGTGTTVKYFPAAPGASIGVANNQYGFVMCPGANSANGQLLDIRAAGNFLCPASDATSPAVTIGLYGIKNVTANINPSAQPSSAFSGSISTLASYQEPAGTPGIVAVPWALKATLNCDNSSGILQGNYSIQVDNGSVQSGAITSLSGVQMSAAIPLAFLIGVTFSQSGSGNTASMYQFDLSM